LQPMWRADPHRPLAGPTHRDALHGLCDLKDRHETTAHKKAHVTMRFFDQRTACLF